MSTTLLLGKQNILSKGRISLVTNEIHAFISTYCKQHSVVSAMSYSHPFTKGGLILVFPNQVDDWLFHVGAAYAASLSLTLHCVRQRELYQLSLPGMFVPPLQVNERPLLPYWLQHRGTVLYGEDLRSEIRPFSPPQLLLSGHIEGGMDYLRRYGILTAMIHRQYPQLVGMLEREMRHLMSTALLIHQVWDISLATLPDLFRKQFGDGDLMALWREMQTVPVETAVYDDAVQAAWLFEQFLQKLRRYTYVPHA